jgi:predicted HAD superfamily Cof-like phosphohydrolase
MNQTKLVTEFNKTFDFPILNINEVESLESRQLRIKLLFEELQELAAAGDLRRTFTGLCYEQVENCIVNGKLHLSDEWQDGNNVNKTEELDAITDIHYLLEGKKLSSGLHEIADEAFELVHGNNMDKIHRDYKHVIQTAEKLNLVNYYTEKIYYTRGNTEDVGYLLFNEDGKLTKPHDHKKVDLKQLF